MKVKRTRTLFKILVLALLAFFSLGPMLYTFLNSFSCGASYGLFPECWSIQGWKEVLWNRPHYLAKFWNSIGLAVTIVLGQIFCLASQATAFPDSAFQGNKYYSFW